MMVIYLLPDLNVYDGIFNVKRTLKIETLLKVSTHQVYCFQSKKNIKQPIFNF